jgi:DNA repair exonuclease SbcCD ATPase subunit
MITYKELRWANAFSYGPSNVLRLDDSQLTQLVGKNGFGKSSIALILEEVQFNTNSKGIKKGNILNRYSKDKSYSIELDFDKDGILHTISTNRTNTSGTVKLIREDVDISSHTATATYKQIEEILGYDHKTFSQIVYQSSVASLEFLTASDTARKKFLIDLLNLSVYTKANEVFKELTSAASKRVDIDTAKILTVSSWLKKYEKEDLTISNMVEVPSEPTELTAKATALQVSMNTAAESNKAIEKNNTYKKMLDSLTVEPWSGAVPDRETLIQLRVTLNSLQKQLKDGKALTIKGTCKTVKCPTCSQDIDNASAFNLSENFKATEVSLTTSIEETEKSIKVFEALDKMYSANRAVTVEWEKYHSLYNHSLASTPLDAVAMLQEFKGIKSTIIDINDAIDAAKRLNATAVARNAKIKVISEQMDEMKADLAIHTSSLMQATSELSDLQVLVKAFSTTGLVAYKIECLVKDLEELTNTYLADMAGGRFQLSFQINSSDKLNVVITDNGQNIDIAALSSGERARVNVSTLLAIRKLMQALSNSRTNLLILDETVEHLDVEGKEKLIEVLLAEDSLNTFLISHGFSHPLLEKLNVVKEHNVSRIE